MVTVGGKPILWHIMKIYAYQATMSSSWHLATKPITSRLLPQPKSFTLISPLIPETIIPNLSGQPDGSGQLQNHFRRYRAWYHARRKDSPLSTIPPKNDKYFMVTYGDGVSDVDLRSLVKFHKNKTHRYDHWHPSRFKYGVVTMGKTISWKISRRNPFFPTGPTAVSWSLTTLLPIPDTRETEHPHSTNFQRKTTLTLSPRGFWRSVDTNKSWKN